MAELPRQENPNRLINYRPIFEIAIGFILGIAACGALPERGSIIIGAVLIIGAGFTLFMLRSPRSTLFLFAAAAGIALTILMTPKPAEIGSYYLTGKVTEVDTEANSGRIMLTLTDVRLNNNEYGNKVRLVVKSVSYVPEIGDGIYAKAEFAGWNASKDNSSGFDEQKYCYSQGIGLKLTAAKAEKLMTNTLPIYQALASLRRGFLNISDRVFGEDSRTISRMLMGKLETVTDEREQLYREAGVSHILAISGLHMSVIVSFAGSFVPKRHKLLRLALIGLFMGAYCVFAVQTAGILRAAVMTFIVLASSCLEKRSDPLSAISLAAILILLFNPYQLWSTSFQLSFAASLGIILLSPPINRILAKLYFPLKLGISTTLSASIATVMLQMHYFGQLSTYTLLANIVAIPLFSIVLTLAFILIGIGALLPGVAAVLAYVPRGILFVTDGFLNAVSNMPNAVVNVKTPMALACVAVLVIMFLISDYVMRPAHKKAEYCFAAALLFTLSSVPSII